MLSINKQDIVLLQKAENKIEAITAIANNLVKKGYVEEAYIAGMLQREEQISTYLGNGIAIPHGITDVKDKVLKTPKSEKGIILISIKVSLNELKRYNIDNIINVNANPEAAIISLANSLFFI
jgi:mannitol/fructose-specific phosphotransferase system IIA component